jgi:hypothetical protein
LDGIDGIGERQGNSDGINGMGEKKFFNRKT